jgi:competence protein ComEA
MWASAYRRAIAEGTSVRHLRAAEATEENVFVLSRRQLAAFAAAAFLPVLTAWTQVPAHTQPPPPPEARCDINHATVAELMKVPGMTHVWAERIVRFRPYHAKNDLLDRGVVTNAVYDRIKDYVIAHRDER